MIISSYYPIPKIVNAVIHLHSIALSTAGNNIVNNISKIIIYSVYTVVNVCSICSFGSFYVGWWISTIITILINDFSELFLIETPFISTSFCVLFVPSVNSIKRGFSFWKGNQTPATFYSIRFGKFLTRYNFFISALTSTKPLNISTFISFHRSKDCQQTINSPRLVNKSSTNSCYSFCSPASTRQCFSTPQTMSTNDGRVTTVTLTKKPCFLARYISWLLSISNYGQTSISVSGFINHSTTLKDAPRMEIGTDVQAVRPIGERVKRKIRLRNCLNSYSIPQMVAI